MILLYHEQTTHGMIATPEGRVAGEHILPRRYTHDGHFLAIDGPEHVVNHDVADILRIRGYRLATAAEQEAYQRHSRQAGQLREDASFEEAEGPDVDQTETTSELEVPEAPVTSTLTTSTAPRATSRRKG